MNKQEYEKRKEKIFKEDTKKIKELEKKYVQNSGLLDGGAPKKERNKITHETLKKLAELENEYKK